MNRPLPLHRGAIDRDDNVVVFPARHVRPIPHEQKARAMGDPDAIYERFSGPPRHVRIGDGALSGDAIALLLGACVGLWACLALLAIKLWPEIAAFIEGLPL